MTNLIKPSGTPCALDDLLTENQRLRGRLDQLARENVAMRERLSSAQGRLRVQGQDLSQRKVAIHQLQQLHDEQKILIDKLNIIVDRRGRLIAHAVSVLRSRRDEIVDMKIENDRLKNVVRAYDDLIAERRKVDVS